MAALYAQEALDSMEHKSFPVAETKADPDAGTFEALVSVFGNVDHVGDRVVPGAFKGTLEKWDQSGDPIPVILSHQWENPMAHIGVVEHAYESDRGLVVKGRLDIGDNDVARQVHRLLSRRSLREFSFGYTVPRGGQKRAKDGANELLKVDLIEVGPTLKGANPATELTAVKAALDHEAPEAPDEQDLRRQTAELKRDEAERALREVPPLSEPEDGEDPVVALRADVAALRASLAELVEKSQLSEDELRKQSAEIQRDLIAKDLPDPQPRDKPDVVAELVERVEDLGKLVDFALGAQGIKAVWTAAYINGLPDSAFLYIEPGGEKDDEGKTTPRSLRHFPYKDADGNIDLPHLRNALSRIPQSSLPQEVKDRLVSRAQAILDGQKASEPSEETGADVTDRGPRKRDRSVDTLYRRSMDAVLEIESDGISKRKSPPPQPDPEPEMDPKSVRREAERAMLDLLTS